MAANHQWAKVYVIQRMHGRPPWDERMVYLPGEMWSAIFGLRDDGRVYYSSFHDQASHAAAESMFLRGEKGWLNDDYCEKVGATTGLITDAAGFTQHCAALAASSVPDDRGEFGMVERKDLEGDQSQWSTRA